jgi:hypothetical protein
MYIAGHDIDVDMIVSAIHGADGIIKYLICFASNIFKRKKFE